MLFKKLSYNVLFISLMPLISVNAMERLKQEIELSAQNEKLTPEEKQFARNFDSILQLAEAYPELQEYIKKFPKNPIKKLELIGKEKLSRLLRRIERHDESGVIESLKEGFTTLDIEGMSPLGQAIIVNDIPIAKLLIEAGANVNFKPNNKFSALVEIRSAEMLEFLIDQGADLDSATYNHRNLLFQKSDNNDTDPLLIKTLAKHFDINEPSFNKMTPLMNAVLNGHIGMVKTLLESGADPRIQTESGTALQIALANELDDFVSLLSEAIRVKEQQDLLAS